MRIPPKVITVYSREKKGFDYKNNHSCNKLTNFQFDNISKINCKMLIVLSYVLSGLELRKILLV